MLAVPTITPTLPSQVSRETGFTVGAQKIAADLLRHARLTPDGSVRWSLIQRGGNGPTRNSLGPYLGSGVLGPAVFFAALDRIQGKDDHREICLGTIARLRRDLGRLEEIGAATARLHAPGGMFGLGSVLYGLAILGGLLREPALLSDAVTASEWLDSSTLRREERLDVVFGLAGLLLALLALERSSTVCGTTPAAATRLLDLAAVCAERLEESLRGRRSPDSLSNAGYSHGTAGVAHALGAFAARTGDRSAERRAGVLLDEAERRLTAGTASTGSWCNGVAGLCVARVAVAADGARIGAPSPALFEALATAPMPHDHLCCGSSGRAEVLLHAGRVLGEPALEAAARRIGTSLVERHREGGLRFRHPEIEFEPRLLRGSVGVGYGFLRLAAPDALPCLLAFEPCPPPAGGAE